MAPLRAAPLRDLFLAYFGRHGHAQVPSASLIPAGDASLMFANAGMVQFKNVFVGAETRPYSRATSCQKCMRVSGKHNDLEAVGRTARHHTFFEMLGNFSFGDYFKEGAIELAWGFITRELNLPTQRLWITTFGGAPGLPADDEAQKLWRKISGLPHERIVTRGIDDNFWSMGDTGPCGPCTEIYVDQGSGPVRPEDFDNGRVMEIWNNVFMQFDRQPAGLQPLPAPSVDTGMGLERTAAVVQGADSNYHTDLFLPLLDEVAARCGRPYKRSASEDDVSMRVVADHARATAFLIADGVQPKPEGRGYVLRRIMRRAIRHGRRLGLEEGFLHAICARAVAEMQAAYPELQAAAARIDKVAQIEEASFRRTLEDGLQMLAGAVEEAKRRQQTALDGGLVFRLYDTFGFPKDLTETIAQEAGLGVDEAGFERDMAAQKARSRAQEPAGGANAEVYRELARRHAPTPFIGGDHEREDLAGRPGRWRWRHRTDGEASLEAEVEVAALIVDGEAAERVEAPARCELVLTPTPFYGEGGGQVGDTGTLTAADGLACEVLDTQRPLPDLTVARVRLDRGALVVGARVWAGYAASRRRRIRAHHSATHLLHAALRDVLGSHVAQAGSRVDADSLRFDFSHFAALKAAELQKVEAEVNRRIAAQDRVEERTLSLAEAKKIGAMALFGEKYGDEVRVIRMGASIELCGGCHAESTADLQLLLITREEAVQSGVRRIEAKAGAALQATLAELRGQLEAAQQILAGAPAGAAAAVAEPTLEALRRAVAQRQALAHALTAAGRTPTPWSPPDGAALPPARGPYPLAEATAIRDTWRDLAHLLAARPGEAPHGPPLVRAAHALLVANRLDERQLEATRSAGLTAQAAELAAGAQTVADARLITAEVDGLEAGALRSLADALRAHLGRGVVGLGSRQGGRANLLVAVSPELTDQLAAGDLIRTLAPLIGGRGGGKPQLAQAGGSRPEALASALAQLEALVRAALAPG